MNKLRGKVIKMLGGFTFEEMQASIKANQPFIVYKKMNTLKLKSVVFLSYYDSLSDDLIKRTLANDLAKEIANYMHVEIDGKNMVYKAEIEVVVNS
jgi:hypothetical protein